MRAQTCLPPRLIQTGDYIASQQLSTGQIPWFTGHFADPWDHVEAVMALGVVGRTEEARAGIEWLARTQRADGSWPMQTTGDEVTEATTDTNQCAYVATGLWHDYLLTGDRQHLARHWDLLEAAVQLVLSAQGPTGAIAWAQSPWGNWAQEALLTGSACTVLSLRCASAIAEELGRDRPHWQLARERLAEAVRTAVHTPSPVFLDKSRYSMDWYYPVLGGALDGAAAHARIDARWADFVVPGYGIRCVDDHPWATPAESCELVLTLDLLGRRAEARAILEDVEMHRDSDGGYWTGYVWPDEAIWPEEKTTWTAAAVILARDALDGLTPAGGLFRQQR
ncbi:MAG: prenyltransferase [Actinomycetia bacterium]|nr:prenyltransferase [Actinomycetes bacterium]